MVKGPLAVIAPGEPGSAAAPVVNDTHKASAATAAIRPTVMARKLIFHSPSGCRTRARAFRGRSTLQTEVNLKRSGSRTSPRSTTGVNLFWFSLYAADLLAVRGRVRLLLPTRDIAACCRFNHAGFFRASTPLGASACRPPRDDRHGVVLINREEAFALAFVDARLEGGAGAFRTLEDRTALLAAGCNRSAGAPGSSHHQRVRRIIRLEGGLVTFRGSSCPLERLGGPHATIRD
jgi:hypothetical protein